jgi:4-hydroxybenzoate polyprenyltransferase
VSAPAALVRACHPEPTAAVTLVCLAVVASAGASPARCAVIGLAVLSGQLSIGWCNDIVDRERDAAVGRRSKPIAAGLLSVRLVQIATAIALAVCVVTSLSVGLLAGAVHLVVVASGWAYDLGVKRTAASWLPYAVSFGLLPGFLVLALSGAPRPPAWLLAAGALLGVGAHFANVLPDIDADLATGVRGLPQRLGAARSRTGAALLLGAASVVLALAPTRDAAGVLALVVVAALLALAFLRPWPADSRTPFLLTLGVAIVDVALLVLRGGALR